MSLLPSPVPRPPIAPKIHESPLRPTQDQTVVLYVMVVYAVVIFALWNIPGFRTIINPLKLMTIGWHELCHCAAAIFSGGTVLSITIDPNLGGCTRVEGGRAGVVLAAGYIGSTILGGVFILGGYDTLAAKILSFFLGIGLITPLLLVRDKLTIVLTFCYEGLLIGFWFIDHASALRWYCLFIGVMNVFYVVWDIADDKFFRKVNDSDATQFGILFPYIPSHIWALLWILFEVGILISFTFIGISSFKLTSAQMQAQAGVFLPT